MRYVLNYFVTGTYSHAMTRSRLQGSIYIGHNVPLASNPALFPFFFLGGGGGGMGKKRAWYPLFAHAPIFELYN